MGCHFMQPDGYLGALLSDVLHFTPSFVLLWGYLEVDTKQTTDNNSVRAGLAHLLFIHSILICELCNSICLELWFCSWDIFYNDKTVIRCEPMCSISFLPSMMPEAKIFCMYSHTDILCIWDSHGCNYSYCGLLVITTCSIVGGYQRFWGTLPHLHGRQCVPPCQYPSITLTGDHNANLWICECRDVPQQSDVALLCVCFMILCGDHCKVI
jgi:hypothetical protein